MEKRFFSLERFSESKKAMLFNGIVCAIPFVFEGAWFLSWFAFLPLAACFLESERVSVKRFARLAFFFGFGYYFVGYVWLGELYPFDYLGIDHAQALLLLAAALVVVPALHAALLSLAAGLCAYLSDRVPLPLRIFAFPCVFVFAEFFQSLGTFAFPWCRVFVTQTHIPALIQSASLFGSYFITYLVLAVNALLACAFLHRSYRKTAALAALALFVGNAAYGFVRMAVLEASYRENENAFQAVVLQGNYPYKAKQNDPVSSMYARYTALCDEALENCDAVTPTLVLLPETALPTTIADSQNAYARLLSKYAVRKGVTLAVGAFSSETDRSGNKTYGNSVFVFTPDGAMSEPYSKRHLVPFGEYLPYRRVFDRFLPMLSESDAFSVDLTPGQGTKVFDTPCGRVGVLICYESVFSDICRQTIRDGAEILLISTNDSSFGSSQALRHHLAQAQMRAVENNVPVLRAANTGLSALIAPNGRVCAQTEADVSAYLVDTLPYGTGTTLYTSVGDIVLPVLVGYLILCFTVKRIKGEKR